MAPYLTLTGAGNGGGGGGTPVDLLIRFEDGADEATLTVTHLNNATLKSAAAAGTWTIPVLAPTIDTAQEITINGLHVAGAGKTDTGTRSLRMNTAADQIQALYTLTTPAPIASCGFAWRPTSGGTFNFYNWGDLIGTNGAEYAAFHHRDFIAMEVGIEDGSSNLGALITVTNATWYWITMLYDNTNNNVKLRVYNPSTWAQIGDESTLVVGYTTDCNRMNIGRTDNHDVFGTHDFFIDDVALCLSTGVGATFPLLPT